IDRPAAPQHDDLLAGLDLRDIDIDRRARGKRVARRIHARDQRPNGTSGADTGDRRRGDRKEIAPRPALVTMRCHRTGLRGIRHEFLSYFSGTAAECGSRDRAREKLRPAREAILLSGSFYATSCRTNVREFQTMRLALYEPDIPQNTGAILRLCACLGIAADLIEPFGFIWHDRHLKRAGMDYLDQVELRLHRSWSAFRAVPKGRLILLTTQGTVSYHRFAFAADDTLLFGRESAGVPAACRRRCMPPPMRACASRCGPAYARSMSRSPLPWYWARRCGRQGFCRWSILGSKR